MWALWLGGGGVELGLRSGKWRKMALVCSDHSKGNPGRSACIWCQPAGKGCYTKLEWMEALGMRLLIYSQLKPNCMNINSESGSAENEMCWLSCWRTGESRSSENGHGSEKFHWTGHTETISDYTPSSLLPFCPGWSQDRRQFKWDLAEAMSTCFYIDFLSWKVEVFSFSFYFQSLAVNMEHSTEHTEVGYKMLFTGSHYMSLKTLIKSFMAFLLTKF